MQNGKWTTTQVIQIFRVLLPSINHNLLWDLLALISHLGDSLLSQRNVVGAQGNPGHQSGGVRLQDHPVIHHLVHRQHHHL